ncbi:MBL fold metallo-hydrolase [Actinoplanes sp. KI2]|uniref:MBL fold metallo-hydrolase n=1 Tax=Actinoplanes sp. KI2 TaxID=2983315 RepID=UPI0021D5B564|nr:MBL fold metallo-hydrolase [Actinoplanes sp. KI2]MCU7726821.1 MBL fold metallo-hydrolase [Actinoplanes sp. KI2]
MQKISLAPVDGVQITTLMDNSSDALLPDEGLVRRWGLVGTAAPLAVLPAELAEEKQTFDFLRAEHGFSAMVEVGGHRILFDTGISAEGVMSNLDRLAIRPETFETIVFSHGHFDHVMGLNGLSARLGPTHLPVFLHPDFWLRRRLVLPDRTLDFPTPSRSAIEGAGFTIIEERQPSFLLDDAILVTGEVDRTTPFETGMPPAHQAFRDGAWEPDRAVHDDQAIVLHVRDRGLVILTGCGHSGIINIIRYAKRLTGVDRLYAVLGGLHLQYGPIVTETVAALAEEAPAMLVPAHCTSWQAQQALAAALPGAFRPNSVGSRFEL